jgi:hypothetical protein
MTHGMRLLPVLLSLACFPLGAAASTVLFSYTGGSAPSTQGWGGTSTSTVVGEAFNDNGRQVWRVYDPGLAAVSGSVITNRTYAATLNEAQKNSVIDQGWELSATISIPTNDPASGSVIGVSSNIWVGFIANEEAGRRLWALQWGRAANGDTLVSAYGVSGTLTLAPGYHDYSLLYDPLTELVTISVDGEVWKTYSGGLLTGSGSNQVYWGDNNGQSVVQDPRAAYYESVTFSTNIPEPSRMLLIVMGSMGLIWQRKRR